MDEKTLRLIIILSWIALSSIVTFIFYGADKKKAQNNAWRISEKFLLLSALFGGAIGALFGMKVFRHKTKHWYFWAVNVFGLLIHVAVVAYLVIILK